MKTLLLLLSALALSSIALAMPTTGRDKNLLQALLGEKDDNLALEQDMDSPLPPYQPSGEEKDARALLQAMKQIAKDQFFRFWAKAQDGEDGNSATRLEDRTTAKQELAKDQFFRFWAKAQDGEDGNGATQQY